MDPKSSNLSSDHVKINIMSHGQDSGPKTALDPITNNIPGNSGPKNALDPITNNIPGNSGPKTASEPKATNVNANTPRKPDKSLLIGGKKYMEICVPLYEAAMTGNWEAAKAIVDKRPELVRFAITPNDNTTLHIAVSAKATEQSNIFVENLVAMMKTEDLEIQNQNGELAFTIAAATGNIHMFEVIVNKHKDLLSKFPEKTLETLMTSASNGNHDMTLHFYRDLETTPLWFWIKDKWCWFFIYCIHGELFDIALKVLKEYPIIGTSYKTCFVSLEILARRPDMAVNRTEADTNIIWRFAQKIGAFSHVKKKSHDERDNQAAVKLVQSLLKLCPISISGQLDILYAPKEYELKPMTPRVLLFTAEEMGNTRFVIELLRMYPIAIYQTNNVGMSIFHNAIKRRNKDIYNLLYQIGSHNRELSGWEDIEENNLLHVLAQTSNNTTQLHQTVSKASILMQRELLWYQEVENLVQPSFRNKKNKDGKTPYEIFSENNKELVSKGLKWTKDCMVVATLIITVAFAVAFTVPGGYNQDTGIPIFHRDTSFLVFIIADAFSLFTSSTSLLVFLSILTSPHGQRDFLYAMPGKLMIGLVALFMSVAAMMITFAASFFVIYQNTYKWLPILICVFAATPVIIFGALQYPFVEDMYRSMFDPRYLFNTGKHVLYDKNKRL